MSHCTNGENLYSCGVWVAVFCSAVQIARRDRAPYTALPVVDRRASKCFGPLSVPPVFAYTSKGNPCEIHSPHRRICRPRCRRFRCCHVRPDQVRSGIRRQQPCRPGRPKRRVATERLIPAVKDGWRRPRRSRASRHPYRGTTRTAVRQCQTHVLSVSEYVLARRIAGRKNVCISPPERAPQR